MPLKSKYLPNRPAWGWNLLLCLPPASRSSRWADPVHAPLSAASPVSISDWMPAALQPVFRSKILENEPLSQLRGNNLFFSVKFLRCVNNAIPKLVRMTEHNHLSPARRILQKSVLLHDTIQHLVSHLFSRQCDDVVESLIQQFPHLFLNLMRKQMFEHHVVSLMPASRVYKGRTPIPGPGWRIICGR